MSADDFLADYWQQQPLLIRGALPDYQSPLSADELAGLATEAEVESRIVVERDGASPWELRQGPFTEATFGALPDSHWTLLVQALDLWLPEVRTLLQHFSFLPPWRLDDVMASYAPRGGSVGPHFDQYDVFLLQVEGERRWQLGGACDAHTPLLEGTDLRIVENFVATEDWLLAPGDMLYLPPRVAHWGVAQSDCLTFSIGFRSPLLTDMLGDLAVELMAQGHSDHYLDPQLTAAMADERIDPAFIAQAKAQLLGLLDNEAVIGDWFARHMSAPKYPELLDLTAETRRAQWAAKTYINGELDEDVGR